MGKQKIAILFFFIVFSVAGAAFALNDKSIQVKMKYGPECKIERSCNDMVYVDCGAAVDGPAYYLDKDLEIIGTSGGLCMQGCSGAPEEWTTCNSGQCDGIREIYTVKTNSSEEDILEFVEFVQLNYKNAFDVGPELDGIDFFANSQNEDMCESGFRIDLNHQKDLIINQYSIHNNCSEIVTKIVTHFQVQKKLPVAKQVEVTCEKRL